VTGGVWNPMVGWAAETYPADLSVPVRVRRPPPTKARLRIGLSCSRAKARFTLRNPPSGGFRFYADRPLRNSSGKRGRRFGLRRRAGLVEDRHRAEPGPELRLGARNRADHRRHAPGDGWRRRDGTGRLRGGARAPGAARRLRRSWHVARRAGSAGGRRRRRGGGARPLPAVSGGVRGSRRPRRGGPDPLRDRLDAPHQRGHRARAAVLLPFDPGAYGSRQRPRGGESR
jgi:hypothetical protein